MKYTLLATDYDGTLATDGIVDDEIVVALRGVKRAGLRIVLVTGRELPSLFNTFAHTNLFDLVVAENGAVLYDPGAQRVEVVAAAAPPALLAALQRAEVPVSAGHSIVATVLPHDQQMIAAIASLGLEWHVIYNKRAVMALPKGVSKSTGLAQAAIKLGVAPHQCVAVGDAENDMDLMTFCGLSAAVDNALPEVKAFADVVLSSARGAGVLELTARLMAGEFDAFVRSEQGTSVRR
jgi:hydroxymethylpyrimidine pyrophosphatase-like HAD family hydrolase